MGDAELCLTFLVRQAWTNLRAVVEDALSDDDLSVPQYAALLIVDKAPGVSVAEIARLMGTARQSANELLAGMEKAGLVERRAHPTDRRAQQVAVTEHGRARLAAATPVIHATEQDLCRDFTDEELAAVRRWLGRMSGAHS